MEIRGGLVPVRVWGLGAAGFLFGVEKGAAVVALGEFFISHDLDVGGGGEFDVAAPALFEVADGDDGLGAFFGEEAFVEFEAGFGDFFGNFRAGGFEFLESGLSFFGGLVEFFDLGGDFLFAFLEIGFGGSEIGFEFIAFFHGFEFGGFQLVDLSGVAFHFEAEFDEFVVFFGFELLVFESFEALAAGADVEFDGFDGHFVLLVSGFGGFDSGLIGGEAEACSFLVFGKLGELVAEVEDFSVAVLED